MSRVAIVSLGALAGAALAIVALGSASVVYAILESSRPRPVQHARHTVGSGHYDGERWHWHDRRGWADA